MGICLFWQPAVVVDYYVKNCCLYLANKILSLSHQATAPVDIDSTMLHRPTAAVFSTYTYCEAQTPLVRFVVDVFYKQIRNKSTKYKSKQWSLSHHVQNLKSLA